MEALAHQRRLIRRQKTKLEVLDSPFHAQRLGVLQDEIDELSDLYCQLKERLADLGQPAVDLMNHFDLHATLHDKAQILNVHSSKLERLLVEYPTDDSMLKLVFVHRAEHRKNAEFISFFDEDTPLFIAVCASFTEACRTRPEVQAAVTTEFDELFPDVRKFTVRTGPDGERVFERIIPPLRVIEPDGTVSKTVHL